MSKSLKNLILLCFVTLFLGFSIPQETFAQQTQYKLLQPLPLTSSNTNTTDVTPSEYITGIFVLLIGIAGALAVVMIIIGGVQYMSTDAFTGKEEAKERIQNALWGFLLAIGAWMILNTINPDLVRINASLTPVSVAPGGSGGGPGGGGQAPGGPASLPLTQQQAIDAFIAGGVGFDGSINLNGIRQGTVDELLRLRAACGCDVLVTSATGGEHASGTCSHANGYKADIRSRDTGVAVTNYIQSNYQYVFSRTDGSRVYRAPSNALYAIEDDHIDMSICS